MIKSIEIKECCFTCWYLNRDKRTSDGKYQCNAIFGYTIPPEHIKILECQNKFYKFVLDERIKIDI